VGAFAVNAEPLVQDFPLQTRSILITGFALGAQARTLIETYFSTDLFSAHHSCGFTPISLLSLLLFCLHLSERGFE